MKALSFGKKVHMQQRGISTLELLIAFTLLTLSTSAVSIVFFGNQSVAANTETNAEALGKAEALLESVRASARADFNLVNPTTTVEKSGLLSFTKTLNVSQIDVFTKQATSAVTWRAGSRTFTTLLSTLFTNPTSASGSGTTCSSVVTGDWKHPLHHEWDMGALGVNGGNGSGFGISNIAIFNKKIYVTMYTTPATNKSTFFIFNQSTDPALPPTFLGSVDNDPASNTGPNSIAIASTSNKIYAYLASPSSFAKGQLQVIDVTNPASPTVVKTFKIPTSAVPSVGTPYTIFYKNGYVYLGLSKITGGGSEFNIIDVGGGSGSPLNPVWKGGFDTGSAVNEMYLRGNYAYLVTAGNENLTILDISNPAAIVRAGGYTPPNLPDTNGVGSNHGETVLVVGSTVFLGRTYGTNEFYILDATTPSAPTVLGNVDTGTGNSRSIYGLAVRGTLAFFTTNTQFQIWDISNPANIKPWSSDGTTSTFLALSALGGSGTAQDCENNYFYLAIASNQGNTKDLLSVISPGP